MKAAICRRAWAALLLVSLFFLQVSNAEEITGRVVKVVDGDTIDVLQATKVTIRIRLAGIDAPERSQLYGRRSMEALSNLVAGQDVRVETHKRDRYQRAVGKVLLMQVDVNKRQIETGMAWMYRQYESELSKEDRHKYESAELEAKEKRMGLWRDLDPEPPWTYRRKHRQSK